MINLLAFIMYTTHFQFDSQYYQQVHSVPMGSHVSVVISYILMEYLEDEGMDTAPLDTRLKIWHRYR